MPKKGAAVNHGVQASVKEVSVFKIVIGEVGGGRGEGLREKQMLLCALRCRERLRVGAHKLSA